MKQPKELPMHILASLRKAILGGGTIAVLFMASMQGEFDFEKPGMHTHLAWNGTWMQPFIPLDWFKFLPGSSSPPIKTRTPKRLTAR